MRFERYPWYTAGPLLGLVIVGLRATRQRIRTPIQPAWSAWRLSEEQREPAPARPGGTEAWFERAA